MAGSLSRLAFPSLPVPGPGAVFVVPLPQGATVAVPGRLTISGNYTQNTNGAHNLEINSNVPGASYDQL